MRERGSTLPTPAIPDSLHAVGEGECSVWGTSRGGCTPGEEERREEEGVSRGRGGQRRGRGRRRLTTNSHPAPTPCPTSPPAWTAGASSEILRDSA
eukprot:2070929-Rhodomonas_salina.5